MADKNTTVNRRKALKSIAAGSGAVVAGKSLPESWSKPVIDSVILPVHAATTNDDLPTTCGPFCATQTADQFLEITVDGTTVSLRGCTAPDGVEAFTGSGQLSGDSFNIETTVGSWVNGSIESDCSGATAQFCIDQAGSECQQDFQLSPGTCGICNED